MKKCYLSTWLFRKTDNWRWIQKSRLNRWFLFEKYDNKRVMISTYHFQTNDIIKKKYKFLIDTFNKMSADNRENWIKHLSTVLWIDRSTMKINIKKTSYFLLCESESVLFIEMKHFIWKILFWKKIRNISDLLIMRVRQLKKKTKTWQKQSIWCDECENKIKNFLTIIIKFEIKK